MKQLKKDLKAVTKGLKQLERMAERLAKRLDKMEKAAAVKKAPAKKVRAKKAAKAEVKVKAPRKRAPRKAVGKPTAIASVLDIITKAPKGVDTATLQKETGLKTRQIWSVINRLKRQGKVKSAEKGVYVAA
jgi:hypothetical protein